MKLHEIFDDDVLQEGVNDKNIFKAVFLVGGPGAGKSTIGQKIARAHGLKVTDVDQIYEYLAQKDDVDISNVHPAVKDSLYTVSRYKNFDRRNLYIDRRLGLLIDGTGRVYEGIESLHNSLIDIGYDCMLIYVNTNLRTSLRRAAARRRSLDKDWVTKVHKAVRDNLGKFQNLFKDMLIIDNSKDNGIPDLLRVHRKLEKFLSSAPANQIAHDWIQSQRS